MKMNGPAMVPPFGHRRSVSGQRMDLDGPEHKPEGTPRPDGHEVSQQFDSVRIMSRRVHGLSLQAAFEWSFVKVLPPTLTQGSPPQLAGGSRYRQPLRRGWADALGSDLDCRKPVPLARAVG